MMSGSDGQVTTQAPGFASVLTRLPDRVDFLSQSSSSLQGGNAGWFAQNSGSRSLLSNTAGLSQMLDTQA